MPLLRNTTRGTVVAAHARTASTPAWRMRGMLGRNFDGFDALVFERNNSIHMFFMHMPLDILFLDAEGRVCGLRNRLRPWRLALCRKARTTIELPAGTLEASGTRTGDRLLLEKPG
jgi:uncharacterized membrane protein (UPF0127 family)